MGKNMNGEGGPKPLTEADYLMIMYDLDKQERSNGHGKNHRRGHESKARHEKLPRTRTVFINNVREFLVNSK